MRSRWVLRQLARDSRGTSGVEYGIILAVIVFGLFAAVGGLAEVTTRMWDHVESESAKARADD